MDRSPRRQPAEAGLTDSPLISVGALADRLDAPDLRIVDLRWVLGKPGAGRMAYEAGHLPGAVFLDLDVDLSDPNGVGAPGRHPLPQPDELTRRLGSVGIGSEHDVLAYDDVGGWIAARLWWMLDNLGHRRVAVLDGGYQAWTAAGLPATTDVPSWPPALLALAPSWSRIIMRDDLRDRLGEVVLLDARAGPRYRGETEPVDAVAGHIPTAINAPTDGNLAPDGRFLAPGMLAARFDELGARSALPVVTSCGSGVAACHHALALRAAGRPDPLLYVGSYSDWTRSGYPVATGPEPGDPPA